MRRCSFGASQDVIRAALLLSRCSRCSKWMDVQGDGAAETDVILAVIRVPQVKRILFQAGRKSTTQACPGGFAQRRRVSAEQRVIDWVEVVVFQGRGCIRLWRCSGAETAGALFPVSRTSFADSRCACTERGARRARVQRMCGSASHLWA